MEKSLTYKKIKKRFRTTDMAANLKTADLGECKNELIYYAKLKSKDSTVDSSTLAMRFK